MNTFGKILSASLPACVLLPFCFFLSACGFGGAGTAGIPTVPAATQQQINTAVQTAATAAVQYELAKQAGGKPGLNASVAQAVVSSQTNAAPVGPAVILNPATGEKTVAPTGALSPF